VQTRIAEQPAFVLHRRNYSESSLLVELFTREYGRIGVLARAARGSRSALPALLQPFQHLSVDYAGSGELPLLRRADASEPALHPLGESALAGLYYNELLMRLLPRNDGHARLYDRYAAALKDLLSPPSLALGVRRFERGLLDELGFGVDFTRDARDRPIDPEQRYSLEPDRGFLTHAEGLYRGRSILAIDANTVPALADLRELRTLLRALIQAHLVGEPLRSWSLMAQLRH